MNRLVGRFDTPYRRDLMTPTTAKYPPRTAFHCACNNQHTSTARHVVIRRRVELDERRRDVGTGDPAEAGRGNVSRAATVHSGGASALRNEPGVLLDRTNERKPNAGGWSRRCHAVVVDLLTMVNHLEWSKSGQWQQSMFAPRTSSAVHRCLQLPACGADQSASA